MKGLTDADKFSM